MNAVAQDVRATACPQCGASDIGIWFPASKVCVTCKTEEVAQRVRAEDCDELAHDIALADSIARIRTLAIQTGEGWYDPNFALAVIGPESNALKDAIKYLQLRGLLEQHPAYSSLFRFVQVQG